MDNQQRLQEIANRGLQDQLDPDKRARFDEAANRGLIQLPGRDINETLQFFQKVAQGATFGFGDEISAAMVGGLAELTGEGDFSDAYSFALENIRADERAFEEQNPYLATGAEIGGAIFTGGLAGAKVLRNLERASTLGRTARIAGVGAAEGALYGAGTAEEDRGSAALQGAGVGAVAAPVGAKVADVAIRGATHLGQWATKKLTDTPKTVVNRLMRELADAEGIDADDAVRIIDDLGPDATVADLGESFRMVARGARAYEGPFKTQARDLLEGRQAQQQQNLLRSAEVAAGKRAGDFNVARKDLIQGRKNAAGPLYRQAFREGVEEAPEALTEVLKRPSMKSAMAAAGRQAKDEGDEIGGNLLKQIHYAKIVLDGRISAAKRGGNSTKLRTLQKLKNDLLTHVDELSPEYREARTLFSSDSAMIDALDTGKDLFRMTPDDIGEQVGLMTPSERDMFKLGAVRAIKDKLDATNMTQDATRKLLLQRRTLDQLGYVFDDPQEFVRKAMAESEFSRTRNAVLMGSQTDVNLAGQRAVRGGIQADDLLAIASQEPMLALRSIGRLFRQREVTPEMVEELADTLLEQGKSPEQIRAIFSSPQIRREVGAKYDEVVLPAIRGAVTPALSASQ